MYFQFARRCHHQVLRHRQAVAKCGAQRTPIARQSETSVADGTGLLEYSQLNAPATSVMLECPILEADRMWNEFAAPIGQEALVAACWFIVGLATSMLTSRALRDGRKEEIW